MTVLGRREELRGRSGHAMLDDRCDHVPVRGDWSRQPLEPLLGRVTEERWLRLPGVQTDMYRSLYSVVWSIFYDLLLH